MTRPPLRHGYTTGACAAAATLGAARMLREQRRLETVELWLPAGCAASFTLHGQDFAAQAARCFVVKDAGDDPDVTNGVEVHAEISFFDSVGADPCVCPTDRGQPQGAAPTKIIIVGGTGIGRVTKPGLAVAVGEWAINPVPRRMILDAIHSVFPEPPAGRGLQVRLSIPDGVERAKQTLNERLGIVGGLSILGTTGIVRPISHQAWTDTLEVALDVALAGGQGTVVLSTGRSSEAAARRELALAEEAFIMMGDFVGHALDACHRRGFPRIVLAAQFAKLVKIAAGHARTHVRDSRLDLVHLAEWARKAGLDEGSAKRLESANTARELFASPAGPFLAGVAAAEALGALRRRAPGAAIGVLLVDYGGQVADHYGEWPGPVSEGG